MTSTIPTSPATTTQKKTYNAPRIVAEADPAPGGGDLDACEAWWRQSGATPMTDAQIAAHADLLRKVFVGRDLAQPQPHVFIDPLLGDDTNVCTCAERGFPECTGEVSCRLKTFAELIRRSKILERPPTYAQPPIVTIVDALPASDPITGPAGILPSGLEIRGRRRRDVLAQRRAELRAQKRKLRK